jgi:hypothetical protein
MRKFKIESEDWTFEGWPGVVPGKDTPTVTVRLSRWDEVNLRAMMPEPEAWALAQGILDCLPTPAPSEETPSKLLVDSFELARQAVVKWGPVAQERMVTEEIGEFLSAFAQYARGRVTPNEVASEIADVILVLASAMVVVGTTPDVVAAEIAAKSARLRGRLVQPEPEPEPVPSEAARASSRTQAPNTAFPWGKPPWESPRRRAAKDSPQHGRTTLPRKATPDAPSMTGSVPVGAGEAGSIIAIGPDGTPGWTAPAAESVPDTDAIIAGTPTVGARYGDCDHTRIPTGTVALNPPTGVMNGAVYVCNARGWDLARGEAGWFTPEPDFESAPLDLAIIIHIDCIFPKDYAEVRRIVEAWEAAHSQAPATTPIIVPYDGEPL